MNGAINQKCISVFVLKTNNKTRLKFARLIVDRLAALRQRRRWLHRSIFSVAHTSSPHYCCSHPHHYHGDHRSRSVWNSLAVSTEIIKSPGSKTKTKQTWKTFGGLSHCIAYYDGAYSNGTVPFIECTVFVPVNAHRAHKLNRKTMMTGRVV